MPVEVTTEERIQLQNGGVIGRGITGGPTKLRYFTPSGKTIFAIPGYRTYVVKDSSGKVIENGTRDANFDKGWLPNMPTELMLDCKGCDKWHRTEAEVKDCIAKSMAFQKKIESDALKRTKRDIPPEDIPLTLRMADLEKKFNDMGSKIDRLLEALKRG